MAAYTFNISLFAINLVIFSSVLLFWKIRLFLQRRKFKREHGCEDLQRWKPVKDPVFGTDDLYHFIKLVGARKSLEYSVENHEKYGDTYGKTLVIRDRIISREPENIKTVLSIRFEDYSIGHRKKSFDPLLGNGIFNADGDTWAHSRALIRPNFVREQVANLSMFERHMNNLLALIPSDGSTVELQGLFHRLTMDAATEFLFGRSVYSLRHSTKPGDTLDGSFADAFATSLDGCAWRSRLGPWSAAISPKRFAESDKICHAYVSQFVDEAVKNRDDIEKAAKVESDDARYVFVNELAKATKDKKQMRDELLNIMLASRDTTAGLLSNLFFLLARRSDVWAKLRQEVEETLHGGLPDYETLRRMKYLKYCLHESLRLHPPVPFNARLAEKDTVLPLGGGPSGTSPIFVAKGTIFLWSAYALHRRKDFYGDDAEDFRPERWESLKPTWEFLPFNGGPRICVGQQYALTEAGYVLVRMVQSFKAIEARDPRKEWEEGLALTLNTYGGVKVALTPA